MGLSHVSKEVRDKFSEKNIGTLLLLRKVENSYDPNAIAVYAALRSGESSLSYEWVRVGYVSRMDAADEFYGLTSDIILEAVKHGPKSFRLTGKTRGLI